MRASPLPVPSMTKSVLLLSILAMATTSASVAVADGHYSIHLQLTALTDIPVKTTVVLHGVEKSATVSAHTTHLTFDYKLTSDQVLDKEPLLLDVSTQTDTHFKTETIEVDMSRPLVHSIDGLIRVVSSKSECVKNYYGPFCNFNCVANEAMHWRCSSEGVLGCTPGWEGPKCEQQVCAVSCKNGGHCDGGRCRCRAGFGGVACDQCIPAVGCMSGSCLNNEPGTCACREGWTGRLCNIDLSMCSKERSPCGVGATCIPKAPGKTICIHPEDNTGFNVELNTQRQQCPCKNGGTCLPIIARSSAPMCNCPAGFGGPSCEQTTVPEAESTIKFVIATNVIICSVVLIVGLVLIVVALRFMKSGRPCGGHAPLSDDPSKQKPQPKMSSVSLLMPDDLLSSPPSSPSKGDDLFTAAKEHSKKVVVFDTVEEPRYSACPKKTSVYSIPLDPLLEKTYETLPV